MTSRRSSNPKRPPQAPAWLVRLIPARHRDDLLADLAEEYETEIQPHRERRRALRWFWGQLLRAVVADLWTRALAVRPRRRGAWYSVGHDLRFGVRSLARSRTFTATATLTLALGIGATTAVFSVTDGVMLKPLPLQQPHRLVIPWETFRLRNIREGLVSYPNLDEWRRRTRVLTSIAGVHPESYPLSGRGLPERINGARVTADFFSTLGVRPAQGRLFLTADDAAGAPDVVVVSAGFWRRFFGDARLQGTETLILNDRPFTIVGVLPPEFVFPLRLSEAELWTPAAGDAGSFEQRGWPRLIPVARLRPNVTVADARSDMERVARELEADYPATNTGHGANVVPLMTQVAAGVSTQLMVFLGAVALVLLVACLNVANLLLVRGADRQRELGVRSALGAARGRIIRLLTTEGLLIGCLGGCLGALLAWGGTEGLRKLLPTDYPRLGDIHLDARALAFAAIASLAACLVATLVPAVLASREDAQSSLRQGMATTMTAGQRRLRRTLVVCEIAASLMVLVGAGLLARSFLEMRGVDPGFDAENVLTFRVATEWRSMDVDERAAFYSEAVERIRGLPGVTSVGGGTAMPLSRAFRAAFQHAGAAEVPRGERPLSVYLSVTPSYFEALEIPLRRGSGFTGRERREGPGVALVNEAAARAFWPDEDPLGKVIHPDVDITSRDPTSFEVVGVVGDVRDVALDAAPSPIIYVPHTQQTWPTMTFAVRAAGDPSALVPTVRMIVNELTHEATFSFQRLDEVLRYSTAERRLITTVIGLFGIIALVLAAVGTFGLLSHSVSTRTRELAVRRALGADETGVLRIVVLEGGALLFAGMALGIPGSLGVSRLVSGLLYGVGPMDPKAYLAACGVLGLSGIVATFLPARRAMRIHPTVALRHE